MAVLLEKEIHAIKEKIDSAREKYKPESIKLLFIAEAPPKAVERFFYYENVRDKDWLYLAIVKALCGFQLCETKKMRANKREILQNLQQDGIFLMDLCPVPLSNTKAELHKDEFLETLEAEKAVDKSHTNVILVKANVFDCLYRTLNDKGYQVQNKRIPFPSSGRQAQFANMMKEALEAIQYKPGKGVMRIKELIK